jgi:hypothetical protein
MVLFGPDIGDVSMPDKPSRLRTPPAAATLGPKYTVTYTVPAQPSGYADAPGLPLTGRNGPAEAAPNGGLAW